MILQTAGDTLPHSTDLIPRARGINAVHAPTEDGPESKITSGNAVPNTAQKKGGTEGVGRSLTKQPVSAGATSAG